MAAGREDLARMALQRKQTALIELEGLDEQIAQLELEQEKLTRAEQRLTAKVEAFRSRKEIIKAQYNAAQAAGQDWLRALRRLRRDGRCSACRRARRGQDRQPARQGGRDRRTCRGPAFWTIS